MRGVSPPQQKQYFGALNIVITFCLCVHCVLIHDQQVHLRYEAQPVGVIDLL